MYFANRLCNRYKAYLELGLRFPIKPFIVAILRAYDLALFELMPNNIGSMVGFLVICDIMGVSPLLRLWRNMLKLVVMSFTTHGEGWYSFQACYRYKIVGIMPSPSNYSELNFYMYTELHSGIYP